MKLFRWNEDKNQKLKEEINISFEEIIEALNGNNLLDVMEHFNKERYPIQLIFIVKLKNYVYIVPFLETEFDIFLKTIIPSRKMKNKYLGD